MGGGASRLCHRKTCPKPKTRGSLIKTSAEKTVTLDEDCVRSVPNGLGSSTNDVTPMLVVKDLDSWDAQYDSSSGLEEHHLTDYQGGVSPPTEQNTFHEALAAAANQLRVRQRDPNGAISKAEMEDLVLLTRELENLKQLMKRSQFTIEDLEEQSKALLRMVGTAVHFYEKPQVTVDMFTKAGARHRGYGVTGEIFEEMRTAFFKVFPKFVGSDVFEASEEEWQKFWKLVLDLLAHGSESSEGERYGKLHVDQTLKKIQADFKLITERQNKCDTRHQFIGIMYAKAIDMFGDLSKFEALKDLRASRRVFQSYVDLINNIHDRERSLEYMRELGGRHTAYNVTIENLRSFNEPFVFACRHFLQDEWSVAAESRFAWLFSQLVDGISAGMESGMSSIENMRAPSNNVSFGMIFTDIEASTKLWGRDAAAMGLAVKNHHATIRRLIADHAAYEVKTVGDSFIIATKDVLVAVKLSLAIQLELMRMVPIAPDFTMVEETEGCGDPKAWDERTLRVRIGVEHCTDATATYDGIHRRYDYYGPSVNRCARIESVACGGQILLSRESFQALKSIPAFHDEPCPYTFRSVELPINPPKVDSRGLDHFVAVSDLGLVALKGINEPVHLVSMVPRCLAGRRFAAKFKAPSS